MGTNPTQSYKITKKDNTRSNTKEIVFPKTEEKRYFLSNFKKCLKD